jgi:hypothetical protein
MSCLLYFLVAFCDTPHIILLSCQSAPLSKIWVDTRIPWLSILAVLQTPENPHAMSFTRNCGFYGTLRSDPSRGVNSVRSNTVTCVADLSQDDEQEIYHILGGPGWKAVLKVKQILPRLAGAGPTFQKLLYWNLILDAITIAQVQKPLPWLMRW